MDGFDVTHTKDGIQWSEYEDEVLLQIKSQIDSHRLPLLDQAQGYRVRITAASLPVDFGADALAATASALVQPAATEALQQEAILGSPDEPPPAAPAHPTNPPPSEHTLEVVRDGKRWTIILELVRDPAVPFFQTSVSVGAERDVIRVQLNLDHQFSITYVNGNEEILQPLMRFVAALALGEKIARDAGVKSPGAARLNANELLGALTSKN